MKASVYNQQAKKINEIELPKEIFEVALNMDLVHQVAVSQASNRRQGTAKAKDRSEVRGGGRKPWRQKGTGRARHGSIRSPLWIGGGVTFGPTTEKSYKKRIPVKMKRKALFMVLSAKAKDNLILVFDDLTAEKPRTKPMAELFNKMFLKKGSGLIALSKKDDNVIKSINNIPKVRTIQAKDLNVLDLLSYKYLIILKDAIKVIKETFKTKMTNS